MFWIKWIWWYSRYKKLYKNYIIDNNLPVNNGNSSNKSDYEKKPEEYSDWESSSSEEKEVNNL